VPAGQALDDFQAVGVDKRHIKSLLTDASTTGAWLLLQQALPEAARWLDSL